LHFRGEARYFTRMLKLYNSMSRTEEAFRPRVKGRVKIFTCGPSTYRRPHVGNYRTFLYEDILVRYLGFSGFEVQRVINFTDVEDKMLEEAIREGRRPQDIAVEVEKRAAEQGELDDSRSPLHPVRVYRELGEVLDRDAIVVGDGGDFVSYAGRFIETYEAGCWMDPGPFGCLGAGPGQAIGAKLAHPDRQVCLLLGDGAFGFAGIEFDTMARHGLGVVGVMGNNGIWALEHHPMKFLYGYSVAAELRPETPYERMVEALGCDGVLVDDPRQLRAALERAFESGRPTLVNVITDPDVVYPRKSNLA